MRAVIKFFEEELEFLLNSYPAPILMEWKEYGIPRKHWFPTVEHFYQFMKCAIHTYTDPTWSENVEGSYLMLMDSTDFAVHPDTIKKLANENLQRSDWDKIKLEVMEEAVRAKFQQHASLAEKLIKTHPLSLVDGEGENHLGKILMKVRAELIYETASH